MSKGETLRELQFGESGVDHRRVIRSGMAQAELFASASELPEGFDYRDDFISAEEEQHLVGAIQQLQFEKIRMHGVVAKRRTVQFGQRYGFETFKLSEAPPIPEFLLPLSERVGEFARCDARRLEEVLVTEYAAGAQIGWHRDAPAFDIVIGVSLLGECTMKFRPWPATQPAATRATRVKALSQILAPRSVYILRGSARSKWQHHIPPTKTLRYSITFRTLR
ncbi:MAG TPA: alpha-ketoglutarate-dependent dioxygenase AlkB [Chthoniobacterales bacterium]|nr:alpha-ketoglutarate-dependent dioxygenase AlkB [Chthoniobacterales bacterium]